MSGNNQQPEVVRIHRLVLKTVLNSSLLWEIFWIKMKGNHGIIKNIIRCKDNPYSALMCFSAVSIHSIVSIIHWENNAGCDTLDESWGLNLNFDQDWNSGVFPVRQIETIRIKMHWIFSILLNSTLLIWHGGICCLVIVDREISFLKKESK